MYTVHVCAPIYRIMYTVEQEIFAGANFRRFTIQAFIRSFCGSNFCDSTRFSTS